MLKESDIKCSPQDIKERECSILDHLQRAGSAIEFGFSQLTRLKSERDYKLELLRGISLNTEDRKKVGTELSLVEAEMSGYSYLLDILCYGMILDTTKELFGDKQIE